MTKAPYQDQVVWIIGASSGIGRALAVELSAQGATLALSARRKDDLDQLKATLGERHKVFALDVTDCATSVRTAQAIHAAFGRIDRIVYMAAAYAPMRVDALSPAVVRDIIDANLGGAFNIVHAALPLLKAQAVRGQIALCASVAGYIGLPGGQPYSATKAAIINLAESLHAECRAFVDVKVINPGFVKTPLTDKNSFEMPFILDAPDAAKAIAKGLRSGRFDIHFPKRLSGALKLLRILPYCISLKLTGLIKT